jgi:adenylate kinase family enzyme
MQRVAIVGSGRAGKSTFAAALSAATGLPVLHRDPYFWHPGWVETPRDSWRQRQRDPLAGERWIADGNYRGTFDERFVRADTVVIVARNRLACLTSALWRTTRNHGKAIQAEGCPERFQLEFYRWMWNYRRDSRPRLDAALAKHPHVEIIELTNRRRMRQFVAKVSAH